MLFWDVLDQPRQLLLQKLVRRLPVSDSYLAGGTALALLCGHRLSVDFDWFTPIDFDPGRLARSLGELGAVRIAETSSGTFHGWIDDIQVTWLRYPNPMLEPLQSFSDIPGLHMPSLIDIGLMKWAAVSDRGARKDFLDLYELSRHHVSLEMLLPLLARKFPKADINYYHMVKSIAYFDDAEREAPPELMRPLDWDEIKTYFRTVQRQLFVKIQNGTYLDPVN